MQNEKGTDVDNIQKGRGMGRKGHQEDREEGWQSAGALQFIMFCCSTIVQHTFTIKTVSHTVCDTLQGEIGIDVNRGAFFRSRHRL